MGRPVVHWEFWSEDAEKASNDLDVYGKRVKEAGGKILVEKMEVPGVRQPSLFQDPNGRVLGMWKQQK